MTICLGGTDMAVPGSGIPPLLGQVGCRDLAFLEQRGTCRHIRAHGWRGGYAWSELSQELQSKQL